jgi:hypothetical protein
MLRAFEVTRARVFRKDAEAINMGASDFSVIEAVVARAHE